MNRNYAFAGAGILLLFLLAIGANFYLNSENDMPLDTQDNLGSDMNTKDDGQLSGYEINAVYPNIRDIMPDLARELSYPEELPDDVEARARESIVKLRTELMTDPLNALAWFELGVQYHVTMNYDAEEEVWLFLSDVVREPDSSVAHDNLGKLYKFSLSDYPRAEEQFRMSIAVNPNSMTPYIELFELYRYSFKTETTAAVDILKEAALKFPDNVDPHIMLGSYHRDRQEFSLAREAYMRALDIARASADIVLVGSLGDELAKLPQ